MTREKKFLITYIVFFALATIDTVTRVTLTLNGIGGEYTWYMWWYYGCGIISIFAPLAVEKLFRLKMSYVSLIVFECFVMYTIFLGSMWEFYYKVSFFDVVAHTFSGVLFAFIGYEFFSTSGKNKVELTWIFLTIFCFAIASGAVWEIIEFVGDALVDGNSQKFMLEDKTPLIGREALTDTMEDIICNTIGALIGANWITTKQRHLKKKGQRPTYSEEVIADTLDNIDNENVVSNEVEENIE